YDAITGLAGTGRVLLAASQDGHRGAEHGLTTALETITAILARRKSTRPGWWLSAEGHPASADADASGMAATGLAHGVAVIFRVKSLMQLEALHAVRHVRHVTRC